MGVQGLWDLLAPTGRRVSVETLSGKKLAIDASIWMVQFMKAMRDERGEMVRNAHLLGFFRRICKLLFLRTKPVFVFDGGTPALKRRTVIARRRQRENAQAKIRKTAEKLLLNHLKAMKLKDLAKDLENQRKNQKNDAKGKKILIEQAHVQGSNMNEESNMKSADAEMNDQENLDEMLAASLAAEEARRLNNNVSVAPVVIDGEQGDGEESEDIIWKHEEGLNGNAKSKELLSDQMDTLETDDVIPMSYNLEQLDEMLAASIAAEESERMTKIASTSDAKIPLNSEGDDEDEEMILPAFSGEVDPAILGALPPSMQLDLLVQMRERLMAENRQKYQKVKKAPEKFSELQIEAYLKTVNFRREINQVQRAAAGKDVGGVQTSRIASEANKEFIFSSSFTGDKQLLRSAGVQKTGENSSNSVDHNDSTSKSCTVMAFAQDESSRVFDKDVETYVDERGTVRVSRVRAMGMRMTRDLQRNLDLMKEIELDKTHPVKTASANPELLGDEIGSQKSFCNKKHNPELPYDNNAYSATLNESNVQPVSNNENSIQISFEVDGESKHIESDDDVFTSLVAGKRLTISSDSASDSDWEEGIIDRGDGGSSKGLTVETNSFLKESDVNDDSEVEWEEGCDVHENSRTPYESGRPASKGDLVEESDLQEAIRRSLEDFGETSHTHTVTEKTKSSEVTCEGEGVKFLDSEGNTGEVNLLEKDNNRQNKPFPEILATAKLDDLGPSDNLHLVSSAQTQMNFSEPHDIDNPSILINKSSPPNLGLGAGQPTATGGNLAVENNYADSVEAKDIDMTVERPLDNSAEDVWLSTSSKICPENVSMLKTVSSDMTSSASVDNDDNKMKLDRFVNEDKTSEAPFHVVGLTNTSEPSKGSQMRSRAEPVLGGDESEHFVDKFSNNENLQADLSEANLQEEILGLNQERITLGHEQKKLERNAESVTSEMFAECQELLQMFGIPYIIAPMEAEAQCAFMELANLVDGVVTDDSDVFLFGGRSVYKNIFDDRKYVETYFMKDIEKELGLTREKLVRMALLLGSDYTEGISGIGIVNAIEVVNAFPEEDGLQKFREWIESPDPNILGKLYANRQDQDQDSSSDHNQAMKQIFMNRHRNVSKNWHVPSSFPSEAVISAYFCPQVDKSTDPFSWGKPDVNVLHRLCWEKFGWGVQKSDELLMPVLKEYDKRETQLRLEAFYTFNERFAKIRSNRIKKAVKGITGNHSSEVIDYAIGDSSGSRKKRTNISGDKNTGKPSKRSKRGVCSSKTDPLEKGTRKHSGKRTAGKPVSSEMENGGKSRQISTNPKRGRGGGRGRGRGKGTSNVEQSDSKSADSSSDEDNLEVCVEKSETSRELRRSKRTRKPASYVPNESDIDDVDKSSDKDNEKSGEEAIKEQSREHKDTSTRQNSQEQHNAEDYVEMGGGFVIEDESGGRDCCPNEAEDYLQMGGGFCVEGEQNPDRSVIGVEETLGEIRDLGERNSSEAKDTGNRSLPNDTGTPSLRAMPFLKRKRRKS